jgi:hypothetical protein
VFDQRRVGLHFDGFRDLTNVDVTLITGVALTSKCRLKKRSETGQRTSTYKDPSPGWAIHKPDSLLITLRTTPVAVCVAVTSARARAPLGSITVPLI